MHFVLRSGAVAAVVALSLGACSMGGEADADVSAGASGTEPAVTIDGIAFLPAEIEVEVGTEVTWTNNDDVLHTVTSGTQAEQGVPGVSKGTEPKPDGMFDGRLDGEGTEFSSTFDEPGTYTYYCAVHVGMIGEVIVE